MGTFFKDLKKGLDDVAAYKKGKITLRSELVKLPDAPLKYKAKDIKKIRKQWRYSQSVFAKILNVSVKTVQAWEGGDRVPSCVALRLLEIIEKGIYRPF